MGRWQSSVGSWMWIQRVRGGLGWRGRFESPEHTDGSRGDHQKEPRLLMLLTQTNTVGVDRVKRDRREQWCRNWRRREFNEELKCCMKTKRDENQGVHRIWQLEGHCSLPESVMWSGRSREGVEAGGQKRSQAEMGWKRMEEKEVWERSWTILFVKLD